MRVPIDPTAPDAAVLRQAARVLDQGGLVAFPTETVYGLCALPSRASRLAEVKRRDPKKAMAYLLSAREMVGDLAAPLTPIAARLVERFWPGPLTLVVRGKNGGAVGLRMPAAVVARELARVVGMPLLQTSANRAGARPAADADAVEAALGGEIDLILDAGPTRGDESSTVVRCHETSWEILREGAIPRSEIERAATHLLLFACTGNICRSPVAEAVMRRELAERLDCPVEELAAHGYRCASVGTMAMVGYPPSENAVLAGAEIGLDIRRHRSRPFSIGLLEEARLIYCLAKGHHDFLGPYVGSHPDRIDLLAAKGKDIRDPYGRSLRVYRKVTAQIVEACKARAEELLS